MKKIVIAFALLALLPLAAGAQDAAEQDAPMMDRYGELLRADLNAEKIAILTEALDLDGEQSAAFWPIYREYELELSKLQDGYASLIRTFAEHFGSMTDEAATKIAEDSLKLEADRTSLKRKYFKKVAKNVSPVVAARFLQTENLISMILRLQIAANLPLIQ